MTLVYSKEEIPQNETKSLFLAGPVPRNDNELSWKKEAIEILNGLGYDGIVYIPEERDGEKFDKSRLEEQVAWEYKCMSGCDAIVFWIPREMREDFEMIALTTNVEFGRFLNTNKLFCGAPPEAERMEYLKIISKDKYEWSDTLEDTLRKTVEYLGEGVHREGAECLIPKHLFESKQFQNWYISQKANGNELKGFHSEYEFVMPKAKQLFLNIFKPDVYIRKENRIKDNEFVVARTDMSYICGYYKDADVTKVLLCEEFRTPANNEDSMIFELVGGSSLKPTDDELQVATSEFEEETGMALDKNRFRKVETKQSAGTLCSHRISLFAVELTKEEIEKFEKDNSAHGVIEDTEVIHLHVLPLEEALKKVDWTNAGMIMTAIK